MKKFYPDLRWYIFAAIYFTKQYGALWLGLQHLFNRFLEIQMQAVVLTPNINKIPELLSSQPHWICWKKTELKPNGRYGKLPTNIQGKVINAHDISQHVDLVSAYQNYSANKENIAGIALDLPTEPVIYDYTDNGEPLYLIGGDIDECVTIKDNRPTLSKQAVDDLKALGNPYWEISPSSTGIRWFGLHTKPLKGGNKDGREMYSQGRFLTITGQSKGGDIRPLPSDIESLEQEWFGRKTTHQINDDLLAHLPNQKYEMPEVINDGEGRNNGILQLAGSLRGKGLSQDEIELGCLGFNQQRINPPLPIEKVLDIARRYSEHLPNQTTNKPTPKEFQLNLSAGLINLVTSSHKRPFIGGDDLIPIGSYSALAGLGGTGKTNLIIGVAIQASVGGSFAGRLCKESCVLMLACEDSETEINARFCAGIEALPKDKQEQAIRNIRVFSLVGQDAHMVKMVGKNAESTSKSDVLIQAANQLKKETGLERCLIVIDHARMIASVDWNDSAQTSVFTREMQRIASETKAGLVVLTHTNKASMNSGRETNQGDVSGSTAIVDNARWVAILHTMGNDDANKFAITTESKNNYVSLDIVKTNYCAMGKIGWFLKRSVPHHSVVTLDHVELAKPVTVKAGDNALEKRLIEYLKAHPKLTINKVKGLSGKKGVFKASENEVVSAIQELMDKGMLTLEQLSTERKKELHLPANTGGVLVVLEGV